MINHTNTHPMYLTTTIRSLSYILIIFFTLLIFTPSAFSQDTYSDTLNCAGGTPTFIVDLADDPDSLWISDPASREGSCCFPSDDNCVQFSLTLADDASGIIFYVPDGCGASPTGALFYQVDCGPPTSVGEPLCLDGPGPFTITFCKPGNNENCYSIQSIAEPSLSDGVTITSACLDSLWITGLEEPSITWASFYPGGPGEYDFLLDCVEGCDSVIVEGEPGEIYPELISYEVCGMAIGGCAGSPFCDSINVIIVPDLFVSIEPEEPTICFGGTGTGLMAIAIGGAEPYTYLWNTGEVTDSVFITEPGTYIVEIGDATGCAIAFDTVVVTEYLEPITADAGLDITICATPAPEVDLSGFVTGSTTAIWSGGEGDYTADETDLNAIYTPSPEELLAGFAELILTTTDNGTCPGDEDTITLFFPEFTSEVEILSEDVDCFGNATGAIGLVVTGGALPMTYLWNTGDITADVVDLPEGTYTALLTDDNGCIDSLEVIINEPELLVVTAEIEDASCFGLDDGSIDITVTGGVLEYDFVWDTGEISADLLDVTGGVYGITVTDANGCITNAIYTINEPTELVATYELGDITCNAFSDGWIDVTAVGGTPGYTYLWNTGADTDDLFDMEAAAYLLTINDENGCELIVEVALTEPDELVIMSDFSDVSCFEESDGTINVTVVGGTPIYSFIWSSGELTEDIDALLAGTYILDVTDLNGCLISETFIIDEPTALTSEMTGLNIACFGDSTGAIDLTISGGTLDYTYLWTTGDITADIDDLFAGVYGFVVTDANGCELENSIALSEPSMLVSTVDGTDEICILSEDGTADLGVFGGVEPYVIEWVVEDSTITEEDLVGLGAGTYYVEVTDDNGCTIIDSVEISSPIDFEAGPDSTLIVCSGDGIIDLNPFLYATTEGLWSELTFSDQFDPLTAQFDLTDLPAGDYVFNYTIPVFTPCTDTVAELIVTVNPKPEVHIVADEVLGCAPMKISFSNSFDFAGSSCVWNLGDGTIIEDCGPINHSYEYPGDYDVSLEVTSDLGCSNSFTAEGFITIFDNPIAEFSFEPEFPTVQDPEVYFSNYSVDAISYDWNFGDGSPISIDESPTHTFPTTANATYQVRLIVANEHGCVDTAIQQIIIEDVLIYYVPNAFTPDGDQYNNTFSPVMTSGYDIYNYHFMIYNRWGEVVFESYNAESGWDGTYGDHGLVEDGVYIWTLAFDQNSLVSSREQTVKGHVTILK